MAVKPGPHLSQTYSVFVETTELWSDWGQIPNRQTVCKTGDTGGDGSPARNASEMVWACFMCDLMYQLAE